ncbi:hypothetical protein ACFL2A_05695, partial [Thermodesulfobacteriota bacterium]
LDTIAMLEAYILENYGTEFAHTAKKKLDRLRWEEIKDSEKIVAVLDFIKSYPGNRYMGDAHNKLDDLRFKVAIKYNQLPNLLDFHEKYPDSKHAEEIKGRIDKIKVDEINSLLTIEELELYIQDNPGSNYLPYAHKLIEKYEYNKVKKKDTINSFEVFIKMHPNNRYVPDAKKKIKELKSSLKKEKNLSDIKKRKSLKATLKYSDDTEIVVYGVSFNYEFNRQPSYSLIPGIDKLGVGFEIEKNKVKTSYINPLIDIDSIRFTYKKKSKLLKMFGDREYALKRVRISYNTELARDLNSEWNTKYLPILDSDDAFFTEIYLTAKLENNDKDIVVQLFEYNPTSPFLEKITFTKDK